jgi:hypothetical protein
MNCLHTLARGSANPAENKSSPPPPPPPPLVAARIRKHEQGTAACPRQKRLGYESVELYSKPPYIFITFSLIQEKFSCNVVCICLSYARPKGRKLFGAVKGEKEELKAHICSKEVSN